LWWSLESRLSQVFAISLSIENFLVSGSYCQSNKEGVFVKSLSCIASGILLNPNSGSIRHKKGIAVWQCLRSEVKRLKR
jgi:hypothetical protein